MPRSFRRDQVAIRSGRHRRRRLPAWSATAAPMKRTLILAGLALGAFAAAYAVTRLARNPPAGPAGMVWVPGGEFTMGTDSPLGRPDERPAHRVRVDGLRADATEVTSAHFRAFVEATGYVTTAEQPADADEV